MTIQVSGKKGLQQSFVTISWQWVGPNAINATGLRRLLKPQLPEWDLSQQPQIETMAVKVKNGKIDGGPFDGASLSSPGKAKVLSQLRWNIKRKDGRLLTEEDIGDVRNAIRQGINREIFPAGFQSVGLQPGALRFTGEVPIRPPPGFGLIGLGMIALAANIKPRPV